jgi:outer membrane protein assembly factor BamD
MTAAPTQDQGKCLGALLAALIGLNLALSSGCANAPDIHDDLPSAESYFQEGLGVLEGRRVFLLFYDVDYPRAIELFQEVIDNYPYSEFATLAELKIADIHYQRGQYELAASYYQDFVELHPRHAKVPYAIYTHGMCAFNEMEDSDRDQESTHEAIAQFRVLLERYPESEYSADAEMRVAQAEDRLAEHELVVADFYFDREIYYSAARRYLEVLEEYPLHVNREKTLLKLAISLKQTGQHGEAGSLFRQLMVVASDPEVMQQASTELLDLPARYQENGASPIPRRYSEDVPPMTRGQDHLEAPGAP